MAILFWLSDSWFRLRFNEVEVVNTWYFRGFYMDLARLRIAAASVLAGLMRNAFSK